MELETPMDANIGKFKFQLDWWECVSKKERKNTLVSRYQHEYEPVNLMLISEFRDAVYGVMPPLEDVKKDHYVNFQEVVHNNLRTKTNAPCAG